MAKFDGTSKDLQDVRKMIGDLSGDETNYPNVKAVEQAKQQAITESANYTDTQIDGIPEHVNPSGGGVVGEEATADSGGAVGYLANTINGGAIGVFATSKYGGSVGSQAETRDGGSVGEFAISQNGFAGGQYAVAEGVDNIQLGTGTNTKEKTLQVYDYTLMNAYGTIPPERLPEIGTTDYADLTNKPKINGVELSNDKTSVDLGVASAIKNTVSGAVVAVNDVADVEHNVEVRVERVNELDISKITTNEYIKNMGNYLSVIAKPITGTSPTTDKLIDICPHLKPNETYTLSAKTTSTKKYFYILDTSRLWNFGSSLILQEEDLNSIILMYSEDSETPAKIEEIQFSKGTTATPYTPYIPDLTQVQLSVTDKNGTKTYTPQTDGTVNGVSVTGYDVTMKGEGLNTTATYNADTKRYIDNKFEELKKLNASTQALALGG